MKTIDVILVTWPNHPKRIAYLEQTWRALQKNLDASEHALRFLCSSETEHDPACRWCGKELEAFCAANMIPLTWAEGPASLGHGMNAAMKCATADLVLIHQDDYELLYPLDLSPGAKMLEQHPEVDMVRYSYPLPQERFKWRLLDYKDGWKRFDTAAHWCYGDEVHLQRKSFSEKHGWYNETNGHAAEGEMVWRLVHDNAIILAADKPYYGHFGLVSAVPREKEWKSRECRR